MGKIEFKVLKELKLVHFIGHGEFDYEYLVARIMDVNKDPDFEFTFNTFVDFEDAHLIATRTGFILYQDFFKRLQQVTGKRIWGIYSKHDETLQNANISHLLVSDDITVNVFTQKETALKYLGLSTRDLS